MLNHMQAQAIIDTAGQAQAPPTRWMTLPEVAEHSGYALRTVRQAIADGALHTWQSGPKGRHRTTLADVDAWLTRKANAPRKAKDAA